MTSLQDQFTARAIPCPTCHVPMLGARVFDTVHQEAFVGVACASCDRVYRVGQEVVQGLLDLGAPA